MYGVQSFVETPLRYRQDGFQWIHSVECASVFKNKSCFKEKRILYNYTCWRSPEGETEWQQSLVVFGSWVK